MPYRHFFCLILAALMSLAAPAGEDRTSFQTAGPYKPGLDIASDQVMVYGVNSSFASRLESWRAQGYHAGFMTGISWGGYEAYYGADERRVREEIQTDASGKRFMHGHSDTVGYNVPTPEYLSFLKTYLNPAIDAGITSFYLEEPEYWARTGWSEGFRRAWQDYYGEPWEAPDSSVAAQFQASRLKYELYYNALGEIFRHIKDRAASQGRVAKCYVPTHSMLNYAHWRIVSPESRLMDLEIADGYIAQVWTGTARTPNRYQGVRKERTFETAFLEYGQMLSMVRPTGRTVWFLADPVEDNPNHTWTDYEYNYKLTLVASLFWPEVYQYEVLPWPDRIFEGRYPVEGSEEKATISPPYTAQLLAIFNALNHMKQDDIALDAGTGGIGLIVSDTLMFQRGDPHPSDPDLAPVYALALPLLKHGVPVAPVQLETVPTPGALDAYSVLLLTYEGQKPLRPAYHDILANWVRAGGALILVGDGADPYHGVPEWWNGRGAIPATPYDDLLGRLGAPEPASNPISVGQGQLIRLDAAPAALQGDAAGAERVRDVVRTALAAQDKPLKAQHYLSLRRGPYVVAMGLDESLPEPAHTLAGCFIDLFDPALPVIAEKVLHPGTPALLYDLEWASANTPAPAVAAASTRIRGEMATEDRFQCTARGPAGTKANVILRVPRRPAEVTLDPPAPAEQSWDAERGILHLQFENQAAEIRLALTF